MSSTEKKLALALAAKGTTFSSAGKAKFRIGKSLVHIRYCSQNPTAPDKFKFNINPNSLSADYELWVCENSEIYYLMPISFLQSIYNNLNAYVDRMHPEIRVVSVDTNIHTVMYASGGMSSSLRKYFCATLP